MYESTSLKELPIGSEACIESIDLEQRFKMRLMEMGFTKGSKIKIVHKGPAGNTIAFEVRNTVIGLRSSDADKIAVKSVTKGSVQSAASNLEAGLTSNLAHSSGGI